MVVHVRWDSDNIENIVSRSDLHVTCKPRVKIWWAPDEKCWKGTVMMTGRRATDTHDEDQASDDDIKLASFVQDHSEVHEKISSDQDVDLGESILDPAESTLEAAVNALNSPSILDELITAAQHETTKDDDACVILRDVPSAEARIEMMKKTFDNDSPIDHPVPTTESITMMRTFATLIMFEHNTA